MMTNALALTLALAAAPAGPPATMGMSEMVALLQTIDNRQRNSGDWKSLVYIEQKEKGKDDLLYEALVFRRDDDDKLMILFTKPKSEAGKGYLRLDKSLFLYDPTVGRWERRTERERIGGTSSQRADFDESRLAEEYTPAYVAREDLGRFEVHHLELRAKEDADVAYPIVHLWVDVATNNVLKQQEHALSGRLMRTVYYPKWERVYSPSKKADVYYPKEIRIYDEVEKDNQSLIVMRQVDLSPLSANIFTKAWLESKSR